MTNSTGLYQTCSYNLTDWTLCTAETCCLAQGQVNYVPTLAGNVLYAALFGLILISSLVIGIRYRTTSFTTWMTLGIVGEIAGYVGRIMLHNNIFDFNAFLTYLIPLTISPAFLTACIYLCLARIIHIMDPSLVCTRLKPMTYTTIFVTFDFISLVLQGAGGGIAATTHKAGDRLGVNIMIAGLAFQVVSLLIFSALCGDFAWRLSRRSRASHMPLNNMADTSYSKNATVNTTTVNVHTLSAVRESRMFKGFVISLAVAVVLILVRSVYRLAELQGGFSSKLANNEVVFMIFEGPMIILTVLVLTIFHPGFCLGKRGLWSMKAFKEQVHMGGKSMNSSEEQMRMVPLTTGEPGHDDNAARLVSA